MKKQTYNTRTLAACAKRLRWMRDNLPAMPECQIVWRFAEGFRLQVEGETHEPGGCLQWDFAQEQIVDIEATLRNGGADRGAMDCLNALLECSPREFSDEELRHLCMAPDLDEEDRKRAFLELGRRHEYKLERSHA